MSLELEKKLKLTIKELKDEHQALKTEVSGLEKFFDLSPSLLAQMDKTWMLKRLNIAWVSTLGYPLDRLLGTNLSQWLHPDDLQKWQVFVNKDRPFDGETVVVLGVMAKDGTYRQLEFRITESYNQLYAAVRDITDELKLANQLYESNELLSNVLDHIPIRIFWKDLEGHYLGCNRKFAEDAGFEGAHAILGKKDEALPWKQFAEHYRQDDLEVMLQDRPKMNIIENLIDSEGRLLWAKTNKVPLKQPDGTIFGIMGTFEDITVSRQLQADIEITNERYQELTEISRAVVFELDVKGVFTYISPIAEKVLGYEAHEIMHQLYFYEVVAAKQQAYLKDFGYAVLERQEDVVDLQSELAHKNGESVWVTINGFCVTDQQGQLLGFRGIFMDITYLKKMEEKLIYVSYHDQLTGLYNRSFFEEELKRLDTPRNYPLGVIMVDVNGLKLMNDAFGHQQGDALLIRVAQVLQKVCRQDDIVCRLGGDEFVVLLPKIEKKHLMKMNQRLTEALNKGKISGITVSASSGFSAKIKASDHISDVMLRADQMMYQDKKLKQAMIRNRMIDEMMRLVYDENPTEYEHALGVSFYAALIGDTLGLTDYEVEKLKISGMLHDVGKVGIDRSLLQKKEPLTQNNWEQVRRHPEISYTILSSSPDYVKFAKDVLYHHEHYDGKGYPQGLQGEAIPLNARIICVADAFDAMTSNRPYRSAMSRAKALNKIQNESGHQFDPAVVQALVDGIKETTHENKKNE